MKKGTDKNRVRRYRLMAYLTQQELAQQAGVSTDTIINIENGRNEPSIKTKRKIAEALNIPVQDIFPLEVEQALVLATAS